MTTDLGATTKEAQDIYRKSRSIVSQIVPGDTLEDNIVKRCIIATGDPAFKDLIVFKNAPLEAGVKAIRQSRPIYTDIRMVQVGITKKGHNCRIHCVLDYGADIAEGKQITRTSAGYLALGEELNDSIIVIGNAPSAAMTVGNMIEEGRIRPALVVAAPVGFVNAAESKEYLRTLNIPSITTVGTRGGTPVAVAIINEIINRMQEESSSDEIL
jgi:precorrin-8X/cobalt-precorrin-8 methylmutase